MNDNLTPHCADLASASSWNFALSILILIGILISYLPQHLRIISLKSSFGISPYFVLLGTTSTSSSLANILVLPRSIQDASCCREVDGLSCFSALLGIFQVGVQWLCFFTILVLFVIYFPRATSTTTPDTSETPSKEGDGPTYRTALAIAGLSIVHIAVLFIISLVFELKHRSSLQAWANFLGILAAVLSSIQYFPQIYTTLKLRCVGSLSIPMMCIQTPGSLVFAGSLAARLGSEGWSTWGVFVVTAFLQGTLLFLAIYFEYFGPEKKEGRTHGADVVPDGSMEDREDQQTDDQPSEDTPLLQRQL